LTALTNPRHVTPFILSFAPQQSDTFYPYPYRYR